MPTSEELLKPKPKYTLELMSEVEVSGDKGLAT